MLLAVGGLMATLAMPGRAVPTLVVTATATAASVIRRVLCKRRSADASVASDDGEDASIDDVTLQWSDVACVLAFKGGAGARAILDDASGVARPGRVLAILGPSGSGKTTLLNALAGRVPASSRVSLHGFVMVNGVSIDKAQVPTAYVTQDDLFFSQLTVRETLDMAATMRLPRSMSKDDRQRFVDDLVRKLGLVDVANSQVGDEKDRGISGGEKKRLSLGLELISTPRLILCDEPTSGLDAFQAERVMNTLRDLAQAGHTVVCSIHQPSSSILAMCDDLILLSGGRQVYSGSAEAAPDHFKALGYPLQPQSNPAEHYLNLISVDYSSPETVAQSLTRIDKLIEACPSTPSADTENVVNSSGSTDMVVPQRRLGPLRQIGVLLVRAWKQISRDNKTNFSRFMSSFMSALLFGAIYWRMGFKQRTIQDRLGLLQVCTINTAMSTLVKTLNVFPREAVLVNRERVRGSYNVFEYLSSKLAAELPVGAFFPLIFSLTVYPMAQLAGGVTRIARFLGIVTLESFTAASYGLAVGALVPSTEAALAIGPATFVLQVVFGGLYITEKSVPTWASWVPRVSIIKHAYEALCVNEFRGLEFETKHRTDVWKGEQVLQRLSWGDSSISKSCISQARVLAFNYLLTYSILSLKKSRFEKLRPPLIESEEMKVVDASEAVVGATGEEGEGVQSTENAADAGVTLAATDVAEVADAGDGADIADAADAADAARPADEANSNDATDTTADGEDAADTADGEDAADTADGEDAADTADGEDAADTANGEDAADSAVAEDAVDSAVAEDAADKAGAASAANATDAADEVDAADAVAASNVADAENTAEGNVVAPSKEETAGNESDKPQSIADAVDEGDVESKNDTALNGEVDEEVGAKANGEIEDQ